MICKGHLLRNNFEFEGGGISQNKKEICLLGRNFRRLRGKICGPSLIQEILDYETLIL